MSRSNPKVPHPCTRWYDWDAGEGIVKYYDKSKEENVEVPLPFTFLALDELAKITGYDEVAKRSIYSNEVHSTVDEVLSVKMDREEIARGFYKSIKEQINQRGGRYTASIYIAFKDADGELQIGNIALKGAGLSIWMDFKEIHGQQVFQKAVQIEGFDKESFENDDGETVEYRVPVFSLKEASSDTSEAAHALDETLQKYLQDRPTYEQEETRQPEPVNSVPDNFDDLDDDLPF